MDTIIQGEIEGGHHIVDPWRRKASRLLGRWGRRGRVEMLPSEIATDAQNEDNEQFSHGYIYLKWDKVILSNFSLRNFRNPLHANLRDFLKEAWRSRRENSVLHLHPLRIQHWRDGIFVVQILRVDALLWL